jgi:hypothetical protein
MPELDIDLGARRWAMTARTLSPKLGQGRVLLHWTGPHDVRGCGNFWTTTSSEAAVFDSAAAAEQAWDAYARGRGVERKGAAATDLDRPASRPARSA